VAKQLETSLDTFARRGSAAPWLILAAVVVAVLFVLLIVSAASRDWVFTGLVFVAFVAAVAFCGHELFTLRRTAARHDQRRIDWQVAAADLQRQSLNIEVLELSRVLAVESAQISDLQSAYIVAEDLALRQIQQEENVPMMRHVTIGRAPFEAVFVKNDVLVCIDVSFLVVPDLRQEKLRAMIRKISVVKKAFAAMRSKMRIRLMMVLVTQLTPEDEQKLRKALSTQRFEETPVDIDIRILDFEALQKIYVTE
jgi:hypothetical protein